MKSENNPVLNLRSDLFVTSIRDFNGIKCALYKTQDGGSVVISKNPDDEWRYSKGINIYDVIKSPPWIADEEI